MFFLVFTSIAPVEALLPKLWPACAKVTVTFEMVPKGVAAL